MAKEIAGPGVEGTVQMLKKAYGAELSAFHYFWYVSQNIEGLGVLEAEFFEERAKEELGHAKKVAFRLMQLEAQPTDEPSQWEQDSGLGKLQPSRYLTLRSALEKALEFEREVIKHYNDLANSANGKDHGTYNLALELLDAELEDEQNIEDILKKLEI
ncbi:MAG TPA: ferritin-like domain-containing protein [Candidatus Nitrosocosmicus sp.]|nr:ferritin-like domain-containing protein [Candidatus Nitrosocosmicus sp.]